MTTKQYLKEVSEKHKKGNATEHSYRGVLENLLRSLAPNYDVTNEPTRSKWGMPDYLIELNGNPIGYIEAKDIGDSDIYGDKPRGNKSQFDRYKANANNLIITDYLGFYLYRNGVLHKEVEIGKLHRGDIKLLEENIEDFKLLIDEFINYKPEPITNASKLASMMAVKARLLSKVLNHSLEIGDDENLTEQYEAFKDQLIEDATHESFADVYAQTIVYGMFAARIKDTSLDNFSRTESVDLIPDSNPFIKSLFSYIANVDLNRNIKSIIEDLVSIFAVCDVKHILQNYGEEHQMQDPIIHFYEDFLNQYDPEVRKARGVWYTPEPVVDFIVRSADEILKIKFNLTEGLLDTSKVKVENARRQLQETKKHRLQIIDPATGTGTFLSHIIKYSRSKLRCNEAHWSDFVNDNIIPRTHGLELLMASYAMAHIQNDLLLESQGCKSHGRLKIYLTNSLEAANYSSGTFFAKKLAEEGNAASAVKEIKIENRLGRLENDVIPLVIGNPPYSVSSSNKGEMIMGLLEDYKKEPGTDDKLKERQKGSINDDYVKFIRLAQEMVKNCGQGVIAYINPHGFIDNVTFRGMRYSLLKDFDEVYVLDLHGNMRKGLVDSDGNRDENVFNIMQGVSINFFVKTSKKRHRELAKVYHASIRGTRAEKFDKLNSSSFTGIDWKEVVCEGPQYDFKSAIIDDVNDYTNGISLGEIFPLFNSGIQTHKDGVVIQLKKENFSTIINDFKTLSEEQLRLKYDIPEDGASWKLLKGIDAIKNSEYQIITSLYRPFDYRHLLYSTKPKALVACHRHDTTKHFISYPNIGLIFSRQQTKGEAFDRISITKDPVDYHTLSAGCKFAPLYTYSDDGTPSSNLNPEIVSKLNELTDSTLTPEQILAYIYGVLHDPEYRTKYNELLKKDFPKIKYPANREEFTKYSDFGQKLIDLHTNTSLTSTSTTLIGEDIVIDKIIRKENKVYINKTTYFNNISDEEWNHTIGGYQPLQKWLKDRKGEELSYEDCKMYVNNVEIIRQSLKLINNFNS